MFFLKNWCIFFGRIPFFRSTRTFSSDCGNFPYLLGISLHLCAGGDFERYLQESPPGAYISWRGDSAVVGRRHLPPPFSSVQSAQYLWPVCSSQDVSGDHWRSLFPLYTLSCALHTPQESSGPYFFPSVGLLCCVPPDSVPRHRESRMGVRTFFFFSIFSAAGKFSH